MNGADMEAMWCSHRFARHTTDPDIKRHLAEARRIKTQQQKICNWRVPGNEDNLEVTIGYEQVAVDPTAWIARQEPPPGLLEDFDHPVGSLREHRAAE